MPFSVPSRLASLFLLSFAIRASNPSLTSISVATEIKANSFSKEGGEIRKQYGRIPYGSPLYWWEKNSGGETSCLYIGQTIYMPLQDRFEGHAKLVRLLCQFVIDASTEVFSRLCSRFDIHCSIGNQHQRYAVEHLSVDQAKEVIDDAEAYLIFENQPEYNAHHKDRRKNPWKPFSIQALSMK